MRETVAVESAEGEYDRQLRDLVATFDEPFCFDDVVRRTDIPADAAWDWWVRAKRAGTLVHAGRRPYGRRGFAGPRLYVLED